MKSMVLTAGVLLLVGCHSSSTKAAHASTISKDDAERTALAQVTDGRIVESELETENGRRVWSFDIESPGTTDITEVQVDAVSGAVVSKERETLAHQARERTKHDAEQKRPQ